MNRTALATLFLFATLAVSSTRAAKPEIGKTARYCNPLPMITAPGGNASGDVIDVSLDGQTYTTALDQTKNAISRNVIFEEICPVKCRFVRLTLTNWPRATPLGIIEFTVFGRPAGSLPAAQPNPGESPGKP